MGHKSTKMTMRYAHHNPESLRPAVEALEKVKSGVCYSGTKRGKRAGYPERATH